MVAGLNVCKSVNHEAIVEEGIHYCVLDSSLSLCVCVCVCGRRQLSIAPEVEFMDFMCSKEVSDYMFNVAWRK